ncbi:carbohydrate ABC transporter permease [Paenibacillus sp. WLX2291]|uniref:carbohydrate ABC transporter permease n=1 Tax=Paenibacillus sp. WLX2291 TaxID=3296934 RepID=UPI003983F58F
MKWVGRIIMILYGLLVAAPLYFVIVSSFKTSQGFYANPLGWPDPWSFQNFINIFEAQPMLQYFWNSARVTLFTVILVLFLGSLISYGIVRLGGRLGKFAFAYFVAGLIIPSQVIMLPLYSLVRKLDWSDSLTALIFVTAAGLLPLTVFTLTGFMEMISKEMMEAGSMDGAGEWKIYWRLVLPLSGPSLSATAAFLFVMVWNDLLIPLLLLNSTDKLTLPLALMQFRGEYVTDYTMLLTGVIITALPMVILFMFLQRFFVTGLTAGSVKG